MLPIAILPAAGLLLGIGGAFSSAATIAAYPMLDVYFLQVIFQIMSAAGNVIFGTCRCCSASACVSALPRRTRARRRWPA